VNGVPDTVGPCLTAAPARALRRTQLGRLPIADGYALAHISDPHLTTLAHVRRRSLHDKRLLGYLSWRRRRRLHRPELLEELLRAPAATEPDHVVVTGDFAQISDPDEFRQAREWLDRIGEPESVSVVPGNHDAYVSGTDRLMRDAWAPFMRGDDGSAGFPYLRRRGPFSLIGVSSAVPSPPLLATGHLGSEQRARLAELLDAEAARIRVLLIHHPPLAGIVNRRKALSDDAELTTVLAEFGVGLVLHGHSHRVSRHVLALKDGGQALVLGAPSASSAAQQPTLRSGYALIRAREEAGEWRLDVCRRIYQPEEGVFVDMPMAGET